MNAYASSEPGNNLSLRLALEQVRRTFDFKGRSTRTEVISYWLFAFICEFGLSVLTMFAWEIAPWNRPWLFTVLAIAFGIPQPALFVRRLHDQDRRGWWALAGAPYVWFRFFGVPRADRPLGEHLVAGLMSVILLALVFWPATDGPNRFGPDPRLDPADFPAE